MLMEKGRERDEEMINEGGTLEKYLTFRVGEEDYGISIQYVSEIVGLQKITPVPDVPPYVKGVINLRGKIIPVLDMRRRLGMPERSYDERTCIIVVNVEGDLLGLIVERVNEVTDIPQEQIEPSPSEEGGLVMGLGKVGEGIKMNAFYEKKAFFRGKTSRRGTSKRA